MNHCYLYYSQHPCYFVTLAQCCFFYVTLNNTMLVFTRMKKHASTLQRTANYYMKAYRIKLSSTKTKRCIPFFMTFAINLSVNLSNIMDPYDERLVLNLCLKYSERKLQMKSQAKAQNQSLWITVENKSWSSTLATYSRQFF